MDVYDNPGRLSVFPLVEKHYGLVVPQVISFFQSVGGLMNRDSLGRYAGILLVLLLINTAYIAAFASPTVFYMGNVVLHLALGVALGGGAVVVHPAHAAGAAACF